MHTRCVAETLLKQTKTHFLAQKHTLVRVQKHTHVLQRHVFSQLFFTHTHTRTCRARQPGNTQSGAVKHGLLLQRAKMSFQSSQFITEGQLVHHTVHILHIRGESHTHTKREGGEPGKGKKAFLSLGVRLGDPHSQTYTHGVVRK